MTDHERQGEGWKPRRAQWPWRDYLTAEERAIVVDAERASSDAKQRLAEATTILNPIRNRAIHRAKYDAQRQP
jgi:hypothetical protein